MLLRLRDIIHEVAHEEGILKLVETTKWGQPSFVTERPKCGTTIRIDEDITSAGCVALYVHCQTSLIENWRERFAEYSFGGNRSVHFKEASQLETAAVKIMIAEALTYHRRRKA